MKHESPVRIALAEAALVAWLILVLCIVFACAGGGL